MIGIIDYGLGNLTSVKNAFKKLGVPVVVSGDQSILTGTKALILPGVGAAGTGMTNLKKRDLDRYILDEINNQKPILGICLGMQLFLEFSEEDNAKCLGIIKGKVRKFDGNIKVPQIGWNNVEFRIEGSEDNGIFQGIKNNSYFYFVNSYYCIPEDESVQLGITNYEKDFCSVLKKDNIYGMQFHPEKSSSDGLKILKNFWETSR